jgi:peptidoglycan biosynthesis protein MviN/MurJ (putative lipid II flippase)
VDGARIAATFGRVAVAASVMALAAWGSNLLLEGWFPGESLTTRILRLGACIGVSIVTLAASAQALRIPEYGDARDLVLRRFRRMRP